MKVIRCENGHFYDAEKYSECPMCKKERKIERRKIFQDTKEEKEGTIIIGKEPSSQIQPNKVDLSKLEECKNVTTITNVVDNHEPSTMKPNESVTDKTFHYVHPYDTKTQVNFQNDNENQYKENDDKRENTEPVRPDDNGETQTGFSFFNKPRHLDNDDLIIDNTNRNFGNKPTRPNDNGETQVSFGNVTVTPEDKIEPSQGHISFRKNNGPVVGWLVAIKGPHIGQSFELFAKKNFIGRNDTMVVNLFNDKTVSRTSPLSIVFNRHNNKFMALTGNSDQTVYINDDLVLQPIELNENDEISIGNTMLVFIPLLKNGKGIEEFYRVE